MLGTVKWFNSRLGYGFVSRNDQEGARDLFVHRTAIAKPNLVDYLVPSLGEGEKVMFDVNNFAGQATRVLYLQNDSLHNTICTIVACLTYSKS